MQLVINGITHAPTPFKHLWGRYVLGFRPWKHCIGCFETKQAGVITPEMTDGTYDLRDDLNLFYLCGVGQPNSKRAGEHLDRRHTNVHLAVRPRKGSIAAIGSLYGVSFAIRDAQAIPITSLPDGFMGLSVDHSRCKNFQFGYQMFAASAVGESAPRDVVRELRSSRK